MINLKTGMSHVNDLSNNIHTQLGAKSGWNITYARANLRTAISSKAVVALKLLQNLATKYNEKTPSTWRMNKQQIICLLYLL